MRFRSAIYFLLFGFGLPLFFVGLPNLFLFWVNYANHLMRFVVRIAFHFFLCGLFFMFRLTR